MKTEIAGRLFVCLLAAPALLLPASVLAYIVWRGLPAIDWAFVTTAGEGRHFGASSGILPQITGSLLLASGACLLASPLAIATALFHCLLADDRQRRRLMTALQTLQGIPPIVFGLCGLIVLVQALHWGISLLTGSVVLGLVVLPPMTVNAIAAFERIPSEQSEAARALGLDDASLIARVWLPQAWPGIVTAWLLAMARGLSETAPILFTATVFSGVVWPDGPFSPVTTLQTHIFYLAQEGSHPAAVQTAWGSALVLVVLILACGLVARRLRRMGG